MLGFSVSVVAISRALLTSYGNIRPKPSARVLRPRFRHAHEFLKPRAGESPLTTDAARRNFPGKRELVNRRFVQLQKSRRFIDGENFVLRSGDFGFVFVAHGAQRRSYIA